MVNSRDSFRLRKVIEVSWSIPEQKISGKGQIFNISSSGISFETDKLFQPDHGMVLDFSVAQIPSFPPKGKLMWFRKVGDSSKHYHCGIRFLKDGTFNRAWIKWMEDNVSKLADTEDARVLDRFLNEGQQ